VTTTEIPPTSTGGEPELKPGVRPIWFLLAFVGCLMAGALVVVVATQSSSSSEPKVWSYTVPPGTGARIEAGEQLYVFPARLDVHVGDQLVIRNDDTRVAEVGPYYVDRNATLTQVFTAPGTISGTCTIHPSGRVTIEVHES
jgi:plastocyanin